MMFQRLAYTALALLLVGVLATPAVAAPAEAPGWELHANAYPTNFVHGVDELQEVTPSPGATSFTLGFEGQRTPAISVGSPTSAVQADLEGLPNVEAGDVTVTKSNSTGAYSVRFTGLLGEMDVAELEASGATVSTMTRGTASGTLAIEVFNVGARDSHGKTTVTDTLPAGVTAKQAGELRSVSVFGSRYGIDPEIVREVWECTGNGPGAPPRVEGATVVTCSTLQSFGGGGGLPVPVGVEGPDSQPAVGIAVKADTEASGLTNRVSIAGGGAAQPAATDDPVTASTQPAREGLTQADAWVSNADGTIDRQAGSHPYMATFVFDVATALNARSEGVLAGGEVRNLESRVPPGLVGDLSDQTQCTRQQLSIEACPPASMVGSLRTEFLTFALGHQVFNMIPPPGVPAELGFAIEGIPVYISFSARTGGDDGITANVDNIPQDLVAQSILTLWGTPGEHSHDRWRASYLGGCEANQINEVPRIGNTPNYCLVPQEPSLRPFLTLPTSCGAPQPYLFRELSGWQDPDAKSEVAFVSHDAGGEPAGFTGCEKLAFEPSITTSPDTARSDSPAGLTVEVKPPLGGQTNNEALSPANIKDTIVTLPEGFVINPGQAAGLQACGAAEDSLTSEVERSTGEENDGPAACPNASKIGTVSIRSPLIEGAVEKQFEGNVYLLQSNPPELRLLLAASADGINLKLVGVVHLNEQTGRIETKFEGTPDLPFTDFKLSFSGGPQAALDTPVGCGTYASAADFVSWASPFVPDFLASPGFALTEGPGGGACPSDPLPFAPSLTAGSTTDQAGGFTGFSMLLQRGDGQQRIEKLAFKVPEGLSGILASVPLCGEPQASQGSCPATSHVGHAVVTSGPGPYPLVIPQPGEPEAPIYLTGPYDGAPFGLSIVTPVIAGPFNLGTIVTRARIEVDPHTAQITVSTDPLPQIVKGVPTDLREVDAVIDRPGFMFNPTNCKAQQFAGTATSSQGTSVPIASPFGVGSCRELAFAPKLTVSTTARTSKATGASLTVKLTPPAEGPAPVGSGQTREANLARVKVDLPRQLPSQLKTLQKACTAKQFASNPAGCPKESLVGTARAKTPLLSGALVGPAYFVSHGNEAFPQLVLVLQGDGVTVDLAGNTFISKAGITSSTFASVPDVPVSEFELTLPQGKYSALAANLPSSAHGSFCGQKLAMPTEFVAQNGAVIHQSTPVSVTGCPKTKKATRARKLTAALKACRKKTKAKRASCQAQADKKYGTTKKATRKTSKKK